MLDRRDRKSKRCNLFDDDGRPRKLKNGTRGCAKDASDCYFVHPYEHGWKTATPSLPPRRNIVADDNSSYHYMLASQDPRRSLTDPSCSLHHRIESSDIQSSKATGSIHMDPGGSKQWSHSPDASSSSDHADRQRRDVDVQLSREPSDKYPGGPHPTESSRVPPKPSSRRRSRKIKVDAPSAPGPRASLPSAPLGLSHTHPPLLLPPQPTPPAFALSEDVPCVSHTLKRLSLEEQRKIWHERVDSMFGSIASRRDFAKIERDLESVRLLSQSSPVVNLPNEDRARIDSRRTALELQLQMKRQEINDAIQHLMATEYWPVLRMPDSQSLERTFVDVKKHVSELRTSLEDLHSNCKELLGVHGTSVTNEPSSPGDERLPKRRRLSKELDAPTQDMNTSTPYPLAELEAFHDKLDGLSRRVSDLDNDVNQRYQIIHDEVELRINERLEEEGFLSSLEQIQVPQADIEAVVNAHSSALVQNIQSTGAVVGELAQEVANLITQHHDLEQRCSSFEVQNEKLKNVIAELTVESDSADITTTSKEVQALSTAVQAYVSNAPPAGAARLSPEYILESLDSEIVSIVRERFTPLLLQVRQDLMDKVVDSQGQAYDTLFPKVKQLTRLVNAVAARVCQPDTESHASSGTPL